MRTNKEIICKLINMTGQHYENMLFENAFKYLEKNLKHDQWGIQQLTRSKYFWSWWTLQWDRRNKLLVNKYNLETQYRFLTTNQRIQLRNEFDAVHDVMRLTIYPNRVVMENSFASMVGEVINDVHNSK